MSDHLGGSEVTRAMLSALTDGEAHPQEVARACAAWKEQPDARTTWHTYHLIGDVMRSDDLAEAGQTSAFLSRFREKLAQEPVVLAPAAAQHMAQPAKLQPPQLHRRAWIGPAAVAAGFVMVVGALLSSQGLSGDAGAGVPNQGSVAGAMPAAGAMSLAEAQGPLGNGGFISVADAVKSEGVSDGPSFSKPDTGEAVLIRDPQLDRLLASQHNSGAAEASFAGQGALAREVVFAPR